MENHKVDLTKCEWCLLFLTIGFEDFLESAMDP